MLRRALPILAAFACALPALSGCFLVKKPDKANIALRKQNQELQAKVDELQRERQGDVATIAALQEKSGSLPTLPRERLDRLFTTHDLKLERLTGGADLDPSKPGQEGLKIHVVPLDQTGDPIKAAGTFTIEAFDLTGAQPRKIGTWGFDVAAARQHWTSVLNRYNYVLPLPWQTPPTSPNLHIEVTFRDELTGARFRKSADVTVEPPPAAAPPGAAATQP